MKLKDIFSPSAIVSESKAPDKISMLQEIAKLLSVTTGIDQSRIGEALIARESLQSTAVGDGIAIPHGKLPEIGSIVGAIVRCPSGIGFDSIDGGKVQLVFSLLAPHDQPTEQLKVLARISRMLKDRSVRESLLKANGADAIYKIVTASDESN
jgi:PTS system nitrogen regulatory IIA component